MLPKIDSENIKKPLCYNPSRGKYILYEEIVSRKEEILSIDELSAEDFKKLVIKRLQAGPDFKVQAISGPPYSRNDVIRAVVQDEPFGQTTVEAEKTYLRDLLYEIKKNLPSK